MAAKQIDFKHVRAQGDFDAVAKHFGLELQKDGTKEGQYKALCPFHDDTRPSLKVNTQRNIYHCFACEAAGNIIDFVMELENLELRPAAERVAEISRIDPAPASVRSGKRRSRPAPPPPAEPETPEEEPSGTDDTAGDGVPYNPPLTFELKLTLPEELKAWLDAREIDEATIEAFGLGLVSKKSRSIGGRLAIPLHDARGRLIGYCGRHIGDDVPADEPKYVLPKGFRKELEVFNLHRATPDPTETRPLVVIFESYFSVMRHAAHVNAVSPMGRSISTEQVDLLQDAGFTRALIVFDGDQPGHDGAHSAASTLATRLWTRVISLPEGVKPHHLPWAELRPHLAKGWDQTQS